MTTKYRVTCTETEGNWCSQCTGRLYDSREEAQAAIDADETAGPDDYGNTCKVTIETVEIVDCEGPGLHAGYGTHGWSVDDQVGGVWWPSDEARAEIEASDDPAAKAVEICETEPERGEWYF
jgi:hypothetical protein